MYKIVNLGTPTASFFSSLFTPTTTKAPTAVMPLNVLVKPTNVQNTPSRKCVTRVVNSGGRVTKIVDCRCSLVMVRRVGTVPAARWVCPSIDSAPKCPAGQTWISANVVFSDTISKAPTTTTSSGAQIVSRQIMAGFGSTGRCVSVASVAPTGTVEIPEGQVQTVGDESQVPDPGSTVADTGTPDNVVDASGDVPVVMPDTTFFAKYRQQLLFGAAIAGGFAIINKLLR